jgi:LPS export ABC transporter protein LptC
MFRRVFYIKNMITVAFTFVIATFVVSCSNKKKDKQLDLSKIPIQTIDSMYAVQSNEGVLQMRMFAPLMQKFENTKESYDLFPKGFYVYGYEKNGNLETSIVSKVAKHTTRQKEEKWSAYGNVVITNYIKGEKIETDTIYWDREQHKIFTDCFVKLYSQMGYMQGYGLESDEMARNAIILKPFDSYGIVIQDSTRLYLDTANFIGPILKPEEGVSLIVTDKEKSNNKRSMQREEKESLKRASKPLKGAMKEIKTK